MASFTQKLSPEALAFFSQIARQSFSQQACAFLNAYWAEIGSQADFIFACAIEVMRYADMHTKGVTLIHLYEEGNDVDFNVGLYFYEKLCARVLEQPEGAQWRNNPNYKASMPVFLTAIVRKQELREKVDVNFDGRISFLEYLLYQYREYCNPGDFCERSMKAMTFVENDEIAKARAALDEVNAAIRAYQTEKSRLEADSVLPGVKGLAAKNLLAQLLSSPLAEKLQTALIKAEAAVRMATKKATEQSKTATDEKGRPTAGSIWWMNAELEQKKRLYGKRA